MVAPAMWNAPMPALPGRALILATVAALALGACGRRGPLEPPDGSAAIAPPPAASAARPAPTDRRLRTTTTTRGSAAPTTLATEPGAVVENAPDEDEDPNETALAVSPSPTPRKRVRAFTVPNEPFLLDPLL